MFLKRNLVLFPDAEKLAHGGDLIYFDNEHTKLKVRWMKEDDFSKPELPPRPADLSKATPQTDILSPRRGRRLLDEESGDNKGGEASTSGAGAGVGTSGVRPLLATAGADILTVHIHMDFLLVHGCG